MNHWDSIPRPEPGELLELVDTGVRVGRGQAHFGVDHLGKAHLLLPLPQGTQFEPDETSRGVIMVAQDLRSGTGATIPHADMVCVDPSLISVFALLVDDILDRVSDGAEPLPAARGALAEWRALLRRVSGVQLGQVVGVRGELEVLARIAESDPVAAVEAWSGPRGTTHDFTSVGGAVEVKATLAHEGAVVQIHGLDQLDVPTGLLLLSFVRLREDPSGQSVADLVEQARSLGVPADTLDEKLERLGVDLAAKEWNQPFATADHRWWLVDERFPGIRRSDVKPERLRGLQSISYSLDLDAGGPPIEQSETGPILGTILGSSNL